MNFGTKKKEEDITKIFTSDIIENIIDRENKGFQIKRIEKIWFKNLSGIRAPYLKFSMTKEEIAEYTKCKLSVHYFAEKYCHIKREDGSIGPMKLREYQKDIIDLYTKNSRAILMASRQSGKCVTFNTLIEINLDGQYLKTTIGEFYYEILSQFRKLTKLEKIKLFLYKILSKI
jgi:hypothetical protein